MRFAAARQNRPPCKAKEEDSRPVPLHAVPMFKLCIMHKLAFATHDSSCRESLISRSFMPKRLCEQCLQLVFDVWHCCPAVCFAAYCDYAVLPYSLPHAVPQQVPQHLMLYSAACVLTRCICSVPALRATAYFVPQADAPPRLAAQLLLLPCWWSAALAGP